MHERADDQQPDRLDGCGLRGAVGKVVLVPGIVVIELGEDVADEPAHGGRTAGRAAGALEQHVLRSRVELVPVAAGVEQ